jgi:aspartate aminotransferase
MDIYNKIMYHFQVGWFLYQSREEKIMISEKMIKMTQTNSVIRAMFEEGRRLAALYGSENVFDFSLGNPNIPSPDSIREEIINIVNEENPVNLHGYMPNIGFPDVRRIVADSLNERFDTSFDENNIIMSSGAAGGLNVIFKTLLNPGDEIIAISPYFVEYRNYAANYDANFVEVPANKQNFQPDPDELKKAVTDKTKIVILNSPNNPTGVVYTEESIKQIAAVLEEKEKELGTSIYIVSDEPYRELVFDNFTVPFLTKYYKNTIICYSWSKSLSLPGQRIGYILIPSEIDDYKIIFEAAGIATRILGFVNASSLIQKVVGRCLNESTDIQAYDTNRKLLYNGLIELGFEPIYPQGAFYLWIKTPCSDKDFVTAAKKYNILLVPGTSFGCPGYARIAYCVSKDTIENSMPAFKKLAKDLGLLEVSS